MNRQVFDIDLAPTMGARFQPTGFPDLGAATYEAPDGKGGWVNALLVESAQSMANRLEGAVWNEPANAPIDEIAGLPWVRVTAADDGRYLTSSRTEAHRLASAFVRTAKTSADEPMMDYITQALGLRSDTPLDAQAIATAVFKLDPLCLVHGVFFSDKNWLGQPKVARAITGAIEAFDVRPAQSGGVKHDDVRHKNKEGGGSSEGYGTVPFQRTEYAAAKITASFVIDQHQINSYGLSDEATKILSTVALLELRRFLESGLRLRTACDLEVTNDSIADRGGNPLPETSELVNSLASLIGSCPELKSIENPVLDVTWSD